MRNGDGKPTVLIVEDDGRLSAALENLLEFEGYRSIAAHSGAEALASISDSNIDAALIDIHLPDMNGLTLSHVLRTEQGPTIPIVIMSGDSSIEILTHLRDAGVSYYFKKPLNAAKLINCLKELAAAEESQ